VTQVSGSADELEGLTERLRRGVQRFDLGTEAGEASADTVSASDPVSQPIEEPEGGSPESVGDGHVTGRASV